MDYIYNTYTGGSSAADAARKAYASFTANQMDGGMKKKKKKQEASNPSKDKESLDDDHKGIRDDFVLGVINRPQSINSRDMNRRAKLDD